VTTTAADHGARLRERTDQIRLRERTDPTGRERRRLR
jgi:hypothetical protein